MSQATEIDSRWKHRLAVNASWLVRLRWVAVVGQLIAIAAASLFYAVDIPYLPLLLIVGMVALTNVIIAGWLWGQIEREEGMLFGDRGEMLLAAIMGIDLLALAGLLYFTGGPTNPFTIFYFVNLTLSAVILRARWSFLLAGVAVASLSWLYFHHFPMPALNTAASPGRLSLQQQGFLIAIAVCACVVVYFITRVTKELQLREAELRVIEKKRASSARLQALATLAAGAGHELASPLSTIAVIANDLSRHIDGSNVPESVHQDVALIRSELDHCRSILDRMSGRAGHAVGDVVSPVEVEEIVHEVLDGLRDPSQVRLQMDEQTGQQTIVAPLEGLAQAIRGVVQNAIDASEPEQPVEMNVSSNAEGVTFIIRDTGTGMPPDVLERAGEPFFTTKEPGKGMGLGLYLTRIVIEQLEGSLELSSTDGVTAQIQLPYRAGAK